MNLLRLFFSFSLFLFFLPLVAQGRLDSVQLIPEVEITADRYKEVIPAQRLAGVQLERLSTNSVADAIRYFSGVQLKDYGGIGGVKTVNIRSMGSNHVGVFYDGIQLGNAQNGQVDLGKFSLDNMEEISLHYGQKSRIFQSAKDFGSSGTIYLQTKRPRFTEGKKQNFQTTFKTGSFGLVNPSFLWERQLTPKINLSLNTEFITANGKYKFRYKRVTPNGEVAYDTTGIRHNGDVRSLRGEGALFGRFNQGSWNLKAYFYDSDRGIPGAVVNNVFKRGERQWDRNFFVQGSMQKELTPRYRIMLNTKYAYDYTHYLRDDPREYPVDNEYWQQEQYVSFVQLFYLIPEWWSVSFSTDFQWNYLRANLTDFAYPKRFTELASLATHLELGPLTLQGSILGTFVQEKVRAHKAGAAAPNKKIWSPALIASYRPFEKADLTFRAFYKHCFRMPTFNDLYYTELGNAYLKPEYTHQYNIGVVYDKQFRHSYIKNFRIQADTYLNQVTDKIIAEPGTLFRWKMVNLGKVKIRGIDLSQQLGMRFGPVDLTTRLNYTYQQARDYSYPDEDYYKDQIPYIPWHSGSAVLAAVYGKWHLNYSFIYVGERYSRSDNFADNYLQPWYTSDLSAGYHFRSGKLKWQLTAEVNNVLNQYYDVVINYPMPGTNFKFIIRMTL